MRLYDSSTSGNAYKVRLLLALLGIAYERVEMDLDHGATRTAEFLALNPNGRIPLLERDDGRRLAESDAILFFLAEGTPYLPDEAWGRAQVLQWMFFEQYSHEPYIAVARYIRTHLPADSPRYRELPVLEPRGHAALAVMEGHLQACPFFVAERYTIADIALYAYTHVAHEGGFELGPYPRVRDWVERCAREPGHVALDA
jgi:glutathione S-transferase